MERLRKLRLLDENGQPFEDRIQELFEHLVYKFRENFPRIRDEVDVLKIFEKSARKLLDRERLVRERDPAKTLESPHGYAWVTLRTVAISEARGASIESHRIQAESSTAGDLVASLPSPDGTPEQLDRQVLLNQFRARLTDEEELVFSGKTAGYSSRQIAEWRGCSPEAIDNMYSRIRKKLRAFVEETQGPKQPKK